MGRFLAIVIVLVVAALLINKFAINKGPKNPPAAAETASADGEASAESRETTGNHADTSSESEPPPQPAAPALTPATGESASAEGKAAKESPAKTELDPETVLLGTGELLDGIPGEGELTESQVQAWLDNPKNHVVLKPELPLGLAAGAAEIKGIDANPLTRAKIELGRQIYFDTRVSSDGTISCASCHDPSFGYAKDTQFGIGVGGQEGGRNSPVAFNRILSGPQFWDGRATSLEDQAIGPMANPIEMGNTHEAVVGTLKEIPGYVKQFEAIFDDGVNITNAGKALASFERALVTNPAPWDYYQQLAPFEKAYGEDIEYIREEMAKAKEEGIDPELDDEDRYTWEQYTKLQAPLETHPISESAIRGGELFFSDKAGCTACHVGANFTDEKYHNLGVGMEADEPDLGRFDHTKDDKDRGAFKTPTVRNISLTGPYMHDGSQKTLMEVVEWYAKGGHPNPHLSEKVKKLDLTQQDKQDLVAFMAEGLQSEFPKVESGRLPK